MRNLVSTAAFAAVLLAAVTGPALADDLPTPEQLKQLADDKKWPELLQGTSRLLALKGERAAGLDRVALWMQKAEAQLQSSQFVPAADSFEKAAEESTATPEQADWATAMSILMRKSDRRGYKPDATRDDPNPRTFDVLQQDQRKDAIVVLFDVQADAMKKRTDKLLGTLPTRPTIELLREIRATQHLERAATQKTERTDAMQQAISAAFADGAAKWSETSSKRIETITADANEVVQEKVTDKKGNTSTRFKKRGLTPASSKELKDLVSASEKLADSFKQIEQALSETARAAMQPAKPTIQRIYDDAKAALGASYRITTVNGN